MRNKRNILMRLTLAVGLAFCLQGAIPVWAAPPKTPIDPLDRLAQLAAQQMVTVPLTGWRFRQPDVTGGERPELDDSDWKIVAPGAQWPGENTNAWFRTRYTVPPTIDGKDTTGAALTLQMGMDDFVEVYVNGKLLDRSHWDDGHVMIAEHAKPGETFTIAARGINTIGQGQLHYGRIVYDFFGPIQPAVDRYVHEALFTRQIVQTIEETGKTPDRIRLTDTLARSEGQVDLGALQSRDFAKAGASLEAARKTLLTLAPLTHQYDVYYIGHAHIDMNWQWPWSETIDVCHRTWDSAMNLMDRFPDFGFVQSQPGAYLAIQQNYPTEFARMQKKSAQGQWDTVGGLWDESDTNMPSGEGLARSLFLGQRYFKANFGHYAETGWLPDSFGHSWQLPQLFQEAGIRSFYHQRGGNSNRFAWWQAPDGSRILTAKTDHYDEAVTQEQALRPFANESLYGLKEAMVVYGVGDHGGGPTRDMILVGKEMQNDPLFPKVHFVTADAYFDHLYAQKRQIADLPVIPSDLQYVAVGCYTAHADIKRAVRSSENNLYTAEVFSSLASMRAGLKYPVAKFSEAWRPTAFAQFHDIMCGSAIHSTYDWMHEQFAPAFAFEKAQTDRALKALTATVDTRSAKPYETPIVVWNALSTPRTEMVRVPITNVGTVTSLRDTQGKRYSTQIVDAHIAAFVAHVPAFGSATYYLLSSPGGSTRSPVPSVLQEAGDSLILNNGILSAIISKSTGAITSLIYKGQEMVAPGQAANVLQVLGDSGSSWDINYTGERHELTAGAEVEIRENGPLCAVVRIRHTFGKSTFTQDFTLCRDVDRLDIATIVEWHEHGQLLKAAFPLNMKAPQARVGIPYGSIARPTNGQENPGQKWMDVTEVRPGKVSGAMPVTIGKLLNHSSSGDFDTENRGYAPELMPSAGVHRYGAAGIPFALAAPGGNDNIACKGQTISLLSGAHGNTLFLLGAAAPAPQTESLTLIRADGTREAVAFALGDWIVGNAPGNESALRLDYQKSKTGEPNRSAHPSLWIAMVRFPAGKSPVTKIVLPRNPQAHIFAITQAQSTPPTPLYGLTVLNDSKYGSDTNGNVFRLTLLRSSNNPDPNPDEGTQTFRYALAPHSGDCRDAENAGLRLNIPLFPVVTDRHTGKTTPLPSLAVSPSSIIAGALKHAEDGNGYILRIFETQGKDTVARIDFGKFGSDVRVEETDILERPVHRRAIANDSKGCVTFPVGHDQIVTLHITGMADGG